MIWRSPAWSASWVGFTAAGSWVRASGASVTDGSIGVRSRRPEAGGLAGSEGDGTHRRRAAGTAPTRPTAPTVATGPSEAGRVGHLGCVPSPDRAVGPDPGA